MSLVPAKCPECGGNVVVDSEKEAWICDFCKTPFIVEKAINTFNTINNVTNNVTNNNEIKADVVNVYENKNSEFVIKAGELVEYNGSAMDVVIPDEVVVIGLTAFKGSNVHTITIHDNVSKIYSFEGCSNLEMVNLPQNLKGSLPLFTGCRALKELIIPRGINSIPSKAFEGCTSIEKIILPENICKIPPECFKYCSSLKRIDIPNNVVAIGAAAFTGCRNLEIINLPEALEIIEQDWRDEGCFEACTSLKNITIPEGIKRLHTKMFCNCHSLETIVAKGIEYIDEGAFENCTSMRTLPDAPNLEVVGRYSSDNDSVGAFEGCTSLREIVLNGEIVWHENTFKNCENLTIVKIQGSMKKIPDYFFKGCKKIAEINLKNVERIPANAFSEETCANLNLELDFIPVDFQKNLAGEFCNGYWENKKVVEARLEEEKKSIEDILVKKIKRRFEAAGLKKGQCPFCKQYVSVLSKVCNNRTCVSHGIKPSQVEERMLSSIKNKTCPSCHGRLEVAVYGQTLVIRCTNQQLLDCKFMYWKTSLEL